MHVVVVVEFGSKLQMAVEVVVAVVVVVESLKMMKIVQWLVVG